MKLIRNILIGFFIVLISCFSTARTLNININDSKLMGKVSLYNDSSFIYSSSFLCDSVIEFTDTNFNRLILQIPGYHEIDTLWTTSLSNFVLSPQLKANQLKEVVVMAPTMMMTDGNKTVISNVAQSYLGEQGNLISTLAWTPGLITVGEGEIAIPGIGRPTIYIDGRKLSSQKELLSVSSQEIDKIEIIRDPGNKYPSGTLCVINITLKKHLKDFMSLNPSFKYSQRSRTGITTALNLNFKVGKFSGLLGATYMHSGSKPTQLSKSIFYNPNTENVASTLLQKTNIFSRRNNLNLFAGLCFELSNQSRLQLQYVGEINHSNRRSNYELFSAAGAMPTADYKSTQRGHNDTHNVSLGYYLDTETTTLSINGAYNSIRRQSNERYSYPENKFNDIFHPIEFESFLSTCEFNHEDDFCSVSGGYNLSYSQNKSMYNSHTTSSNIRDHNLTINPYIGISKSFSKVSVEGSISYLYDTQRYRNTPSFSKHYNVFSPFVSVSWKHKRKKFSLSYRSNQILPAYYELSPSTEIIDSLNYYVGNLHLKPSKKNTIQFYAGQWNGFTGSVSYNWQRNSIVECLYSSPEYNNLVITQPQNLGKQDNFKLNISYNVWNPKYNISLSTSLDYTTFKMPGNSLFGVQNKLSAMIMLNARYTLGKRFNIFTNSWYRSPYIGLNQTIGYTMALNIGISASFLKKSLNVSLSGSDLLNTAVSPTSAWTYSYNFKRFNKFDYDGRTIVLSVSYSINSIKTKFEKSDSYADFLDRTSER